MGGREVVRSIVEALLRDHEIEVFDYRGEGTMEGRIERGSINTTWLPCVADDIQCTWTRLVETVNHMGGW